MIIASIEAEITANPIIKEPPMGPKVSILVENSVLLFKRVSCIYHPVRFKKNQAKVQALLDFDSEVNAMTPAYMARLGLKSLIGGHTYRPKPY